MGCFCISIQSLGKFNQFPSLVVKYELKKKIELDSLGPCSFANSVK